MNHLKWTAPAALGTVIVLSTFSAHGKSTAPDFPPLTGVVVDNAHVLSDATHRKLVDELSELHARTGHSLVVVTVASLNGRDIATYGVGLFRTWQLGRKGFNDGAILLIAPNDHRDRIEVGYGLEPTLTDAQSSIILRDTVRPYLLAGDYDAAALAGERAIADVIGGTDPAIRPPPPKPHPVPLWEQILTGVLASLAGLGLILLIRTIVAMVRKRPFRRSRFGSSAGSSAGLVATPDLTSSSSSSDSSGSRSFDIGGSDGGGGASDSW